MDKVKEKDELQEKCLIYKSKLFDIEKCLGFENTHLLIDNHGEYVDSEIEIKVLSIKEQIDSIKSELCDKVNHFNEAIKKTVASKGTSPVKMFKNLIKEYKSENGRGISQEKLYVYEKKTKIALKRLGRISKIGSAWKESKKDVKRLRTNIIGHLNVDPNLIKQFKKLEDKVYIDFPITKPIMDIRLLDDNNSLIVDGNDLYIVRNDDFVIERRLSSKRPYIAPVAITTDKLKNIYVLDRYFREKLSKTDVNLTSIQSCVTTGQCHKDCPTSIFCINDKIFVPYHDKHSDTGHRLLKFSTVDLKQEQSIDLNFLPINIFVMSDSTICMCAQKFEIYFMEYPSFEIKQTFNKYQPSVVQCFGVINSNIYEYNDGYLNCYNENGDLLIDMMKIVDIQPSEPSFLHNFKPGCIINYKGKLIVYFYHWTKIKFCN